MIPDGPRVTQGDSWVPTGFSRVPEVGRGLESSRGSMMAQRVPVDPEGCWHAMVPRSYLPILDFSSVSQFIQVIAKEKNHFKLCFSKLAQKLSKQFRRGK